MGNPIPTKIKFKHYVKAIEIIAQQKNQIVACTNGSGSARRFDLFLKETDKIPAKMWTAHEDKVVWTGDLKKACDNLGVNKKDFEKLAQSL